MSKYQPAQHSVSLDQVTAFRLARHHLTKRASKGALLSVVLKIGGAQAQLLSAAQIALWARVRDLRIAQVEEALTERLLVKVACMRRTLFLVPSESLAIFVQGSARRAEKKIRWARGKGHTDREIDGAIEAVLSVLDQPLTRSEIAGRVSRALGVRTQAIHGGGWGSRRKGAAVSVGELTYPVIDILRLAAARGVVCYGPDRGNEPTFVRADAWIPDWQDLALEKAEDLLLRIYLRAFGPATATDFAMWTGMTLREAREIWAREQNGLTMIDVEGLCATILREELDELAQAKFEPTLVCLLPHFDTFLLGHKDRQHLISPMHREEVFRTQGWIDPVVLVDGRTVAVWKHAPNGITCGSR